MGILVNRVFNGSYNSGDLGHEIIDFYTTDDGDHVIYIVNNGVLGEKHNNDIDTILITEPCNDTNTVHVIAKAIGLEHIATREPGDNARDVRNRLDGLSKRIKYDNAPLNKIFPKAEDVAWVTFRADKMLRPKEPTYLTNDPSNPNANAILVTKKVGARKQSLYFENTGNLANLINDDSRWEDCDQFKPINSMKDYLKQVDSTIMSPSYPSMVKEFVDRIRRNRVTITKKVTKV